MNTSRAGRTGLFAHQRVWSLCFDDTKITFQDNLAAVDRRDCAQPPDARTRPVRSGRLVFIDETSANTKMVGFTPLAAASGCWT